MPKVNNHEVALADTLLHRGPLAIVIRYRRSAAKGVVLDHQLVRVEPLLGKQPETPLSVPPFSIGVGTHGGVADIESHRFPLLAQLACGRGTQESRRTNLCQGRNVLKHILVYDFLGLNVEYPQDGDCKHRDTSVSFLHIV